MAEVDKVGSHDHRANHRIVGLLKGVNGQSGYVTMCVRSGNGGEALKNNMRTPRDESQ